MTNKSGRLRSYLGLLNMAFAPEPTIPKMAIASVTGWAMNCRFDPTHSAMAEF